MEDELNTAPYIVWIDYGYEGWKPKPYQTLQEALEHNAYGSRTLITKRCEYRVEEALDPLCTKV